MGHRRCAAPVTVVTVGSLAGARDLNAQAFAGSRYADSCVVVV